MSLNTKEDTVNVRSGSGIKTYTIPRLVGCGAVRTGRKHPNNLWAVAPGDLLTWMTPHTRRFRTGLVLSVWNELEGFTSGTSEVTVMWNDWVRRTKGEHD